MKNNLVSRITAISSSAAILLCAASCGKKEKEAPKASELINNSYRSVEIDCDIDIENVDKMSYIGESDKIFISGYNYDRETYETTPVFCITDTEFSSVQKLDLNIPAPENGYLNVNTSVADGKIYAFAITTDYGDFKLPDYNSPDFDAEKFDYEAMEKAAKTSYSLYSFDESGNQLSVTDIDPSGISEDDESGSVNIGNMFSCGSDKFVVEINGMDQSYYLMESDGTFSGKLELDGMNWINSISIAADGNIAAMGYGENSPEIRYVDPSTLAPVGEPVQLDNFNGSNVMIKGTGDYSVYLSSSTALIGLKDGQSEEIVNWINSDINGDYVSSIIALDNGDFLVYINDWQTNENSFCRLTKRDSSELENTKVITIAVLYPDQELTSRVTEFNKSSSEYRFRITDYSQYSDYDAETQKTKNTPANQLKMDIAAGKEPDMIYCSDYSLISSLAPKGTFTDLYPLIDNDSSLSREDIMPNILKACEMDGKLVSLSNSFSISTWGAKKKYVDKDNWTFDEMVEIYDGLSSKMDFIASASKENVFSMLCYNTDSFVDYKNGTCSFDSPEFIKYLEFCDRFPKEDEIINWDTATDDEMQEYWSKTENAVRNDKCLLSSLYFNDFRSYARTKQAEFGEDISLVGAPSSNGSGSSINLNANFAILESSPSKEACWNLISGFFSDDYYSKNSWELPVRVSAFEKMADEAMSRPYWTDENGKKTEYDDTYYMGDKEYTIKPLTQEERDYFLDFIKNVSTISNSYSLDITQIIEEESQAFFNGEKTAEETAKMIQNRASILVSEQS